MDPRMPLFVDSQITAFERTAGGGLRIPAALTRPGVFGYQIQGKPVRIYRSPETVFDGESLATLKSAPVTVNHPPDDVTPDNWVSLSKGHVEEPCEIEGWVAAGVVVSDGPTIARVEKRELLHVSVGFEALLDLTPGTSPEGELFDGTHTRIRYNHLALLDSLNQPRAGAGARLILDSTGNPLPVIDQPKENNMDPEEIKKLLSDLAASLEALTQRVTGLESGSDSPTDATAQGEPSKDNTTAVTDSLPALIERGVTDAIRREAEREAVVREARTIHPMIVCDGKSAEEIKVEAIKHFDPSFNAAKEGPLKTAIRFGVAVATRTITRDSATTPAQLAAAISPRDRMIAENHKRGAGRK